VLPRDRPLGLPVPNQPDRHRGRSLGRSGAQRGGLARIERMFYRAEMAPEPLFEIARRRFDTPEFRGMEFIEAECKTIINPVPRQLLAVQLVDQPVQGLFACLLLLLRPADAHLSRHERGLGLREEDRRQGQRARGAPAPARRQALEGRGASRWARTPIRTSAPRAATA
jgi:hypothetical protein